MMFFFQRVRVFLFCFFAITLLFIQTSNAARVFSNPDFLKCEQPLRDFLMKNTKAPLELLISQFWTARFVVNPNVPLTTIYSLRARGPVSLIELHADQNTITVSLTSDQSQTVWLMNQENCKFTDSETLTVQNAGENSPRPSIDFENSDLETLLTENSRGVIYFWSPHMVLSVLGIQKIEGVCKDLGVKVTVLLDPHASEKEAKEAQTKYGFKKEYLMRVRSKALQQVSPRLHYPNIVLYKNKMILPANLSGYKSSTHYLEFIERYLGGKEIR